MSQNRDTIIANAVAEYGQKLLRFIHGKVKDLDTALDIRQDVWFRLTKQVEKKPPQHMGGWLFKVAGNRITDDYREELRKRQDKLPCPAETNAFAFPALLVATDLDPEQALMREMLWDGLNRALDLLNEQQRTVFILNEIEGMTLCEIGRQLNANPSTLNSQKRKAVSILQHKLLYLYRDLNAA